MAYCEYCGTPLNPGVRYCPNCGAPAPAAAAAGAQTGTTYTSSQAANAFQAVFSGTVPAADYDVVLVSTGVCPRNVCVDLLEDTMGYTQAEAVRLISFVPVKIATGMGRRQARVVAQALAEYGAQVAVFDKFGKYVDLVNEAAASVYNSKTGAFLASTVAVLATLGVQNRPYEYVTYRQAGLAEHLFRMLFKPAPPVHVRRPRVMPSPQPTVQPVSARPRAAAQPKPAAAQPRPAQAAPRPATAQPRPTAAKPAAQRPAGSTKPSNSHPAAASRPGQSQVKPHGPAASSRPSAVPKNRGDR